jgi:monofunctional biosynthetic peptidoglycan transglycosylase
VPATPEPDRAAESSAAESPPIPSPQSIAASALVAPALVRPLGERGHAEAATATAAAQEVLAPPPPPPPPIAATPSRSVWPGRIRRAALIVIGLVVGYAVLVLALIVAYRWVDPPRSTLMLANHLTGEPVLYAPVPIARISSYLQRAVVTSEDARFCYHNGVDWAALYEAMSESRGGSTITMQTAKNLFLWPSRSYIRKAIEIPVAMTIDAFWPKRRILEVYLNIAEWGPGIFGAEAASHYHFDKPASRLTAHEATLLAASLPNPIARDAGDPGRVTEILASRLRARLGNSDAFVTCLGLRTMRSAPAQAPRKDQKAPQKAAPKAAAPKAEPKIPAWQTTTDPAFNPWQN